MEWRSKSAMAEDEIGWHQSNHAAVQFSDRIIYASATVSGSVSA